MRPTRSSPIEVIPDRVHVFDLAHNDSSVASRRNEVCGCDVGFPGGHQDSAGVTRRSVMVDGRWGGWHRSIHAVRGWGT